VLPKVTGYGLGVRSIPGDWSEVSIAPSPRGLIDWVCCTERLSSTEATWWLHDEEDGFVVGWRSEAQYELRLLPSPTVHVSLGPADEIYAALSFVIAVLPLSLPYFGLEPFHGSAVGLPSGGALAILAPAGVGKSTTAASLLARGFVFLADDASAIDEDGMLWPGPPVYAPRLVSDISGAVAEYEGKSVVRAANYDGSPRPVERIVILSRRVGAMELVPLDGADACLGILSQVRAPWALAERRREAQLGRAALLARQSVVARLEFDPSLHAPADVEARIEDWLADA
jgi:hypothetical protein